MSTIFQPNLCTLKFNALLICMLVSVSTANAFSELNKAQTLIYDTSHLQNTEKDQVLMYLFNAQEPGQESVQDTVELSVQQAHENGTRDVVLNFLSAERHIAFPDFSAFKGNPVIIAMLEHIAQRMGRDTGGGALYFRNRIRDALAGEVEISHIKTTLGDKKVDATVLTFEPFLHDQYIRGFPQYVSSKFSLSFSAAVAGGLLGITVVSADANQTYFSEELMLKE